MSDHNGFTAATEDLQGQTSSFPQVHPNTEDMQVQPSSDIQAMHAAGMYSVAPTSEPPTALAQVQNMAIVPVPEPKKGATTEERTLRAVKSPNLLAFNLFALETRSELRARGDMNGAEVEKEIGVRWAGLDQAERLGRVEAARQEQGRRIAQCPVDQYGQPQLDPLLFFAGGYGKKSKKKRNKSGARFIELKRSVFSDMTGLKFDCVVDGEFDVGYFFTAKARDPGHGVLRGMLFKNGEPSAEASHMEHNALSVGFPSTPLEAAVQMAPMLAITQ